MSATFIDLYATHTSGLLTHWKNGITLLQNTITALNRFLNEEDISIFHHRQERSLDDPIFVTPLQRHKKTQF
jgi:hypothetical protein